MSWLSSIISLFFKKPSSVPANLNPKPIVVNMSDILTLNDYLTSSNRYPERLKSPELNDTIKANATELLKRVNALLAELGITEASISSGFRPSSVNSAIPNAAKKSAHMTGEALDIVDDKSQSLCKACTKELLIKHGLYREDSDYTKGWCHLQTRVTGSGNRVFKP